MIHRAYLNDVLFYPPDTVVDGQRLLDRMISLCDIAANASLPVYYNDNLFLKEIVAGIRISTLLASDKERKQKLSAMAQKLRAFDSREDPESVYTCSHKALPEAVEVNGTVMPDAYECACGGELPLLLNFSEKFPPEPVRIYKDKADPQDIHSCCGVEPLTKLCQKHGLLKRYYSPEDTFRPNDYQTILTDKDLFTPTKYGNRGNRLYRRIAEPNELWCLDRGHTGPSAHLEVFSESEKKQIHVSKVDKIDFFRKLTTDEANRRLEKEDMP